MMNNTELIDLLNRHPFINKELNDMFCGHEKVIYRWMTKPKEQLLGRTPAQALLVDSDLVLDMLYRIKTGDMS